MCANKIGLVLDLYGGPITTEYGIPYIGMGSNKLGNVPYCIMVLLPRGPSHSPSFTTISYIEVLVPSSGVAHL